MVSHPWIIECLDFFGVEENITSLLVVWKSGRLCYVQEILS